MSKLKDFYKATTKRFDVSFLVDNVIPNIVNDTVTVLLKTSKGSDVIALTKNADVTTSGSTGVAKFTLSDTDTNIAHGKYYYQIIWVVNSETYVVDDGTVAILERV